MRNWYKDIFNFAAERVINLTYWISPCNPKVYNVRKAFTNLEEVNWHQGRIVNIKVGDVVFIYESHTTKGIILKTEVIETDVRDNYIDDEAYYLRNTHFTGPWMRLKLIKRMGKVIPLNALRIRGFKSSVQSLQRIDNSIVKALNI